jgi:hypothetical protein
MRRGEREWDTEVKRKGIGCGSDERRGVSLNDRETGKEEDVPSTAGGGSRSEEQDRPSEEDEDDDHERSAR